jgi:hypothetical protein
MEEDINRDDDDGVVSVLDVSIAKAGAGNAEVLQHARKTCKTRSAVAHAGAIPDKNSFLALCCCCEELSLCKGLFASSLVDRSVGGRPKRR